MTKAEAGRKGGLSGDGEAKAARMREARKNRIAKLEQERDEAREVARVLHRVCEISAGWNRESTVARTFPWINKSPHE